MAKINRYDGNVEAFASQAATNKRTTFGTEDTGDDTLDGNVTPDYLLGWQIVGPSDFPTLEDFNALGFTTSQFIAYLHQMGIPEWNGDQEYQEGSQVSRAGSIYSCNTLDHKSATPPESDATNWTPRTVVASEAESQALSSLTKLLTPGRLNDAFKGDNQSLNVNGFQYIPGGLVIQWGEGAIPPSNTSITVNFPITYPSSCLGALAIVFRAGTSLVDHIMTENRALRTASGTSFNSGSSSGGINFFYLSIGI